MHLYRRRTDAALSRPAIYSAHSEGYTSASLVDNTSGSVHTGLTLNELAPGGSIQPHVHAFEEGFYVLEGTAIVGIGERAYRFGPGDYAALKVGTPHAWRTAGSSPVRWLQMAAPQPKPVGAERDTFFVKSGQAPTEGAALAAASGELVGHFDASQIPPEGERPPGLAKGVFLKWLIDEAFGARHHRLLFIEYQPGAGIGRHDHTFEEAYFILTGEIQGTLDGERYVAKAGDTLWTSVGCVHTFTNVGSEPVRWLETFAPQPPDENVFRFMEEWEKRAKEIEG